MLTRLLGLAGLLVCLIAFRAADAAMLGDATVPFSGDVVVRDGTHTYAGKIFAVPGRQRLEHMINDAIPAVIILRADLNKGWLILPGFKSYTTFQFPPAVAALGDPSLLGNAVGREQVNGRLANRYRIDRTIQDGSTVHGFLDLTPEGILMRADGTIERPGRPPMQDSINVTRVVLGPQTPALFELPYGMTELPPQAVQGLLSLRMGKPRS